MKFELFNLINIMNIKPVKTPNSKARNEFGNKLKKRKLKKK